MIQKNIKYLFSFFFLFIVSCTTSPYHIFSISDNQKAMESKINPENIFETRVHSTASIRSRSKPIYLSENNFSSLKLTEKDKFIDLCNKKRYQEALITINGLTISEIEKSYLKALMLTVQGKFDESLNLLENIKTEELESSIQFLILDNKYELERKKDFPNKKQDCLKRYQTLFDNYSLNKIEIEILRNRVKHLRYE